MLENWPPAKGPRPKNMGTTPVYTDTRVSRQDIRFKLSKENRLERRELVTAVMAHHENKRTLEKISVSSFHHIVPGTERRGAVSKVGDTILLNHHVDTVGELSVGHASRLIHGVIRGVRDLASDLGVRTYRVQITYPLTMGVELSIRPALVTWRPPKGTLVKGRATPLGYVLWMIAQEYRRIYSEWRRYGVWGHAIDDLYFEELRVLRGGRLGLVVGSQ